MLSFNLQVTYFFAIWTMIFSFTIAEKENFPKPKTKMDCVNDLVEMCNNRTHKTALFAFSTTYTTYTDHNGDRQHVRCSSNSDGLSCRKNGSPLVSCSSNHTLEYKGKLLKKNSTEGIGDDVCEPVILYIKDHERKEELHNTKSDLRKKLHSIPLKLGKFHVFEQGLSSKLHHEKEHQKSLSGDLSSKLNKEKKKLKGEFSELHNHFHSFGKSFLHH